MELLKTLTKPFNKKSINSHTISMRSVLIYNDHILVCSTTGFVLYLR